ncbi:MAG TPA: Ig-like domain-containing protein [Patescibacteria group bacterium]|nr:Ig-like domain-containing protein [Patescibacteria group bacterium]
MKLSRNIIIAIIVAIGLVLIAIFNFGFGGQAVPVVDNSQNKAQETAEDTGGEPRLISSTPPELFKKQPLVFAPDKVIELHFNAELENGPETKLVFDPPADVEVKLSADSKTAIITPKKPYKLGQGYTLFIKPDAKLKGGKTLGKGYDLHFNIVNYSGI